MEQYAIIKIENSSDGDIYAFNRFIIALVAMINATEGYKATHQDPE